jgi:hypothetical protein
MWKTVAIAAVLASNVASAAARPETGWLIDRAGGKPLVAQVWSIPSDKSIFVWRVLSASGAKLSEMREPALTKGYEYSYGECTLAGKLAPDVIAEVKADARSLEALEVRRAWSLDPASNSFKETDPHGLVCYSADYGF